MTSLELQRPLMGRWFAAAAAGLLFLVGLTRGLPWSDSASPSEIKSAVGRLGDLEEKIGDWEGRPTSVDPRELAAAEIAGCVSRRYTRPDGQAASLLLVCGSPGPISAHTPEYCFVGAGLEMVGRPRRVEIVDSSAEAPASFWVADFEGGGQGRRPCRAYWSWSDGGPWLAEGEARIAFAGSPVLHKLYVVRQLRATGEGVDDAPGLEFLGELLPRLRRALPRTQPGANRSHAAADQVATSQDLHP